MTDLTLPALFLVLAPVLLLTVGRAVLIQWRYVSQVERTMRTGARRARREEAPRPPPPRTRYSARPLRRLSRRAAAWARYARRARRSVVWIYAAAGAAHLLTSLLTFSYAAGGIDTALLAYPLTAGLLFLCPLVLTVGTAMVASTRVRLLASLPYLAALFYFRWEQAPRELLMLLLTVGVPALIKMSVMNRRLKTTGTLVLMSVATAAAGLAAAAWFALWAGTGWALGLVLCACAAAVSAQAGRRFVADTARRYREKRSSEQTIILDNFWLLQTECFAFFLTLLYGWRGLLAAAAFVVYAVVVRLGFRLRAARLGSRRGLRLLVLRTFEKSEREAWPRAAQWFLNSLRLGRGVLFERVEARWRYVGGIHLITGPDLAQETLDPAEFDAFGRGALADRHIDGPRALRRELKLLDLRPDPDGRYRVNEFLCHDHAWRDAVWELARRSDAVLFDLRAFTREHAGAADELGILFGLLPVGKLVFVADATTDFAEFFAAVEEKWARRRGAAQGPRALPRDLRIIRVRKSRWREVEAVVGALLEAAVRGAPRGGQSRRPAT